MEENNKAVAKVYYTDFRCKTDEGPADKLKRLIKTAGIADLDLDGKFVAIKMHFGELGNMSYLRPNYAKAVADTVSALGGKPFLTDCHAGNDAPIIADVGMFASTDPLALDQACVDACLKQAPLPGSQLYEEMAKPGFHDHHDHFCNANPNTEYQTCLEHAEKIGLGTRRYELVQVR